MRVSLFCLFLVSLSLVSLSGCGRSNEATVAPRTAEEVEAYKADVYSAEAEDAAAGQEE